MVWYVTVGFTTITAVAIRVTADADVVAAIRIGVEVMVRVSMRIGVWVGVAVVVAVWCPGTLPARVTADAPAPVLDTPTQS
jgi:hypothetical protein